MARTYTNYRLNKDIERAKATDINEAVKRLVNRDESLVRENANKDSNVYATQRDLLAGAVSKASAFSMLPDAVANRLVNRDESLVRENANKDSNVYATQRDLLAGAVSKASAFSMLPDAVANAHMKGDIHFHDADYSPFTSMNNCSLPDFGDMLRHGFALGNAMMDSPKSIGTAATQITQIIKDIAGAQYGGQTVNRADEMLEDYAKRDYAKNSPKSIGTAATQITQIIKDIAGAQYGGQTVNRADEMLEDYAKRDYAKNMDMARAMIPDSTPIAVAEDMVRGLNAQEPRWLHFENREPLPMDEAFDKDLPELDQLREVYAKIMTRKAIYDAMQTMEYQINSNRVSNGQTPFVTVGFGLGTSWFAREIQRAILLNRIRGLGKDRHTAIFPKLVFTIKHGINVGFGLGTSWFAREIQRAILLNRIRGLGKDRHTAIFPKLVFTIKHGINADEGDPNYDLKQLALECSTKRMYPDVGKDRHTAIFPKLVFTIKHGINADEGDPNYDLKQLALECSTKRMYPDVVFYDNIVKITGSFKAPMGCRSFLQGWIDPRGVLRQHREDHRLVQGADGLPLVPAGLDRPEDR